MLKPFTPNSFLPTRLLLALLLGLLLSMPAQADIMVLIHGYLGDASSWEKSGINNELDRRGWQRAGLFLGSPQGPQLFTTAHNDKADRVYVATLPSDAPIVIQADLLKIIIDKIRDSYPEEAMILVGHSAGGVVARMALVRHRLQHIKGLVTIASPHLGTGRADQALDITANHGPFNMVKSFVGGSDYQALKHSRALLFDLRHPQPGNLLYWLNAQPHPDIQYASIIRTDNNGRQGDYFVPGYSQNMNNVAALQGKSATVVTPTSHFLVRQDADTILRLIEHW